MIDCIFNHIITSIRYYLSPIFTPWLGLGLGLGVRVRVRVTISGAARMGFGEHAGEVCAGDGAPAQRNEGPRGGVRGGCEDERRRSRAEYTH